MNKPTWVLLADEAIARILERPAGSGELQPVEELTDPDAHARESELHRAPHGRRGGAGGGGSLPQATVSAADSGRHQHAQAFAARIVQRLALHHREGRYEALRIVAAPRLLGYLRKALPPELAAAVTDTLDKDLVQASNAELTQRLFPPP
jgi:protein required for attachment to host cells